MSDDSLKNELTKRRIESLKHSLGPVILNALADPAVIEIMLNDDGKLFIESFDDMKYACDISPDSARTILDQIASNLNVELSEKNSFVTGELKLLNGERFEGTIPPIVENSTFAIRKKSIRIFTLDDYVKSSVLSFKQQQVLIKAINEHQNILVVGSTSSGKTTFCNALLHEVSMALPDMRMIIMEDTKELQCSLLNRMFFRTGPSADMARISESITRYRPDSISVGEVRAGAAALSVLKLWNTGHPGGFCTVHANSAYDGLIRLDQLIQEVSMNPQRELIGSAVNVVVFLKKTPIGRRVEEIVRVNGYDEVAKKFLLESIK